MRYSSAQVINVRSPWQDIRYGLRLIRRSPGFSAVVIVTLALGIGANTAIFSILDALLVRSLPVAEPDRLVQVAAIYRNGTTVPFSYPVFQQLEENQRVFSDVLGWTPELTRDVEIKGRLSLSTVRAITGNYYGSLGATPLLGRLIGPDDTAHNPGVQVAVLGYEFWEREFGRRADVIGKVIHIDDQAFTIVGVSRRWFTGVTPGSAPDITVPITSALFARSTSIPSLLWINVTARLKENVTPEQARAQLGTFWRQALAQNPPTTVLGPRMESWMAMGLEVNPAATGVNRDLREHFSRPLLVLMGIAGLILLVACVNLASLTLARAAVRSAEMSVRMSLGATRAAIARQLLTESVLLSGAGTMLALALARWTSSLLVALLGGGLAAPVILDVRPDWRVFGFAVLVSIVAGVVIALAPAWQFSRQQPAIALNQGRGAAGSTGRLGKALIVTQIALSFVLLLGAGLLLRTFQNLRAFDPQYQRAGVLEVVLHQRPEVRRPVSGNLRDAIDAAGAERMNSYRKQLLDEIASLPDVMSASLAGTDVPSHDRGWRDTVSEVAVDAGEQAPQPATFISVSPAFFRTLAIPVVAGRDFNWNDDDKHPRVAIVDTNVARRLRHDGNVAGLKVRFGVQPELQQLEIVGVVKRARIIDVRDEGAGVFYVPCSQLPNWGLNLFVRAGKAGNLEKAIEPKLETFAQEYAVASRTLDESTDQALAEDRATAMLSSWFAGLALLLAGIGLFGLMSYAVTRRTREMGIRLALGSQRAAILRLVMQESLMIILAGVAIGIPCALLAARLIARVLFGVSTADPATLVGAATALLCVGALGGYLPARRATRTDPMIALRCE